MASLGIWKQQPLGSASLLSEEQRGRETQVRCPEDSWLKPCLPGAGAPTAKATAPVRHQKRLYGGECKRGEGFLTHRIYVCWELRVRGGSRLLTCGRSSWEPRALASTCCSLCRPSSPRFLVRRMALSSEPRPQGSPAPLRHGGV